MGIKEEDTSMGMQLGKRVSQIRDYWMSAVVGKLGSLLSSTNPLDSTIINKGIKIVDLV